MNKIKNKKEETFFIPPNYIKISTQYVYNAIQYSKELGYDDYVIIDRCTGTGNLESQFDIDIYPHLILGTIDKTEAIIANKRFNGLATVKVIDALSNKGVMYYQKEIEKYKFSHNFPKLAIIILENPPCVQINSNKKGGIKPNYTKTFVHEYMKYGGNNLDEQFIHSAYFYNPFSYIHFGSIKSWKSRHFIGKEVRECYLCNRKYFNASTYSIALIHWGNKDVKNEYLFF